MSVSPLIPAVLGLMTDAQPLVADRGNQETQSRQAPALSLEGGQAAPSRSPIAFIQRSAEDVGQTSVRFFSGTLHWLGSSPLAKRGSANASVHAPSLVAAPSRRKEDEELAPLGMALGSVLGNGPESPRGEFIQRGIELYDIYRNARVRFGIRLNILAGQSGHPAVDLVESPLKIKKGENAYDVIDPFLVQVLRKSEARKALEQVLNSDDDLRESYVRMQLAKYQLLMHFSRTVLEHRLGPQIYGRHFDPELLEGFKAEMIDLFSKTEIPDLENQVYLNEAVAYELLITLHHNAPIELGDLRRLLGENIAPDRLNFKALEEGRGSVPGFEGERVSIPIPGYQADRLQRPPITGTTPTPEAREATLPPPAEPTRTQGIPGLMSENASRPDPIVRQVLTQTSPQNRSNQDSAEAKFTAEAGSYLWIPVVFSVAPQVMESTGQVVTTLGEGIATLGTKVLGLGSGALALGFGLGFYLGFVFEAEADPDRPSQCGPISSYPE